MTRVHFSFPQRPANVALYVHLPWCVRKCPYCDFNSHRAAATLPVERYVRALTADLRRDLASLGRPTIASVFIGGGTPSLFPPDAIGNILDAVRGLAEVEVAAEITMEANPGTIERGRFAGYREAGVSRVSLGAQSFDDASLAALGRIHRAGETLAAVDELKAAGFDNFNLDLMHGLPGQTVDGAVADLATALSLAPAHLSHYQLTLEPGTPFARRPPVGLPDEDVVAGIQEACGRLLADHGYQRYEVSAYARPGRQCRHNLNYWSFGDYLGIGAGAHGKRSTPEGVTRTAKLRSPGEYMSAIEEGREPGTTTAVATDQLPFEFMLNALRLCRGFEPGEFTSRTGLEFDTVSTELDDLSARGLVEYGSGRWRATARGFDFLNVVIAAFLPESGPGRARP